MLGDIFLPTSRLYAAGTALVAMLAVWLFLKRTYLGIAIRAVSQDRAIMPLMGVDTGRIYLITSAIGGGLAGLGACLLVLQYDVHPAIGLSFGPITFMVCVMGGLGNLIGGFIAAFIFAQFISVGGFLFQLEWGYVMAFVFFIADDVPAPAGPARAGLSRWRACLPPSASSLLAAVPLLGLSDYHLHILILILLWAFIYTGWSIMGRFGLVSLGHGAFLGIGAYTVTMLWNHFGITPWLGIPVALALARSPRW